MRRRLAVFTTAALAAFTLSACVESNTPPPASPGMSEDAIMVSGQMRSAAAEPVQADRMERDQAGEAEPVQGALLAYSHSLSLRLPGQALGALYQSHVEACEAAGLDVCQIVNANLSNAASDRASANLALRAAPGWIAIFKTGLSGELEAADGSVIHDQTRVEDLTTQIVDGEARLRARIALRDRLQTLLETREADLDDLVAVERELARVQGEIESRESVIAALRQRVQMSQLWIDYQPAITPATRSNFAPISDAISNMGRVFAEAFGALILFLAAILPWTVIGLPLLWLLGRWIGRVIARRREAKAR
ncbi:MAG: DUF4349 domain-containing protein [Pseudomonadota bacterium]